MVTTQLLSSSRRSDPVRLLVGRIASAHGLRGEVLVTSFTQNPERFIAGADLVGQDPSNQALAMHVDRSRPHGRHTVVKFSRIDSRTAAEAMQGVLLFVDDHVARKLDKDEYWVHELDGLSVVTAEGTHLGKISEVLSTPANDVWRITSGDQEYLIPAIKSVVLKVDLELKTITIDPLPGLLDG